MWKMHYCKWWIFFLSLHIFREPFVSRSFGQNYSLFGIKTKYNFSTILHMNFSKFSGWFPVFRCGRSPSTPTQHGLRSCATPVRYHTNLTLHFQIPSAVYDCISHENGVNVPRVRWAQFSLLYCSRQYNVYLCTMNTRQCDTASNMQIKTLLRALAVCWK